MHLNIYECLRDIQVEHFDLSASLILPEGCTWRSVSMACGIDYKVFADLTLPSNWPPGASLGTTTRYQALSPRWHMDNEEDVLFARAAVAKVLSAPFGPDALPSYVSLFGTHASTAILAPLSGSITSVQLSPPSRQLLFKVAVHLPKVHTLVRG